MHDSMHGNTFEWEWMESNGGNTTEVMKSS